MKELKLEMKLVKILEILHKQKVKLLANKKISYSSLHDVYQRVELIYDTLKNNKLKPEYYTVSGELKQINLED
jgi:hypothetical protein